MSEKALKFIIIGLVFLLILLGLMAFLLSNRVQIKPTPPPNPSPVLTSNSSEANWQTYQNHKMKFNFPPDWKLNYDNDLDATKTIIAIGPLTLTLQKATGFTSLESLDSIRHLATGNAKIISKEEVQVAGQRAYYVIQDNNHEGIIMLNPDKIILYIEIDTANRPILNKILLSFKFI